MAENKAPTISPIKHIEYECKQSEYEITCLSFPGFYDPQSEWLRKDNITEYDIRYLSRMF